MNSHYKLHPFFEDKSPPKRRCEKSGCDQLGEYRAPMSPSRLREYYWFCLEHVREYNLNWDYYKRMSQEEIERTIREDVTWQRPTWKFGHTHFSKAHQTHFRDAFAFFTQQHHRTTKDKLFLPHSEEAKALRALDLQPPIDSIILKKRYKELVKKFHPDVNAGSTSAQERLKEINQAYSLLKKIFT